MTPPAQIKIYQYLAIAAMLGLFMLLTRGSHVLTLFSLPDASLAIFLLGGILLQRMYWFIFFFMMATAIDFGAAAFNPYLGFCLTDGYWGMIPTYGVMWLGGRWLATRHDTFALLPYVLVTISTTFLAFIISTQTYYLFSGRFPNNGLQETILHGWNYLPEYLGYAMMYFAMIWAGAHFVRQIRTLWAMSA